MKYLIEQYEVECKSVPTGWQSSIAATGELFGPVFRDAPSLWKWQKENFVYSGKATLKTLAEMEQENPQDFRNP